MIRRGAFGLRVPTERVFPALTRAASACALPEGARLELRDLGRAGTWVHGTDVRLEPLAAALATELGAPVRLYTVQVIGGRLRADGCTCLPGGDRSPIVAAREDAPAADVAEAAAWLAIRLEVQEGLDDHDAAVRSLVWPWAAE